MFSRPDPSRKTLFGADAFSLQFHTFPIVPNKLDYIKSSPNCNQKFQIARTEAKSSWIPMNILPAPAPYYIEKKATEENLSTSPFWRHKGLDSTKGLEGEHLMPGQKSPKRKRRFVRLATFLFVLLGISIIAGGILLAYLFITPRGRGNIPLLPSARQPGDLIATFSSTGHTSEQVNLADISPPDSGHLGGGGPKIL